MTLDDDLRDALAGVGGEQPPPTSELLSSVTATARRRRARRRAIGSSLLACAVLVAGVGVLDRPDDDEATRVATRPADSTTSSARPSASTTSPESTTTTTAAAGPPARIVGASDRGRVVVLDSATGRAERVLGQVPRGGAIAGVSVSADGVYAYWGAVPKVGACDHEIVRARIGGSDAPQVVGSGRHPRISPDGRKLAYLDSTARRAPSEAGEQPPCNNVLIVRDLASGSETMWVPGARDDGWFSVGAISEIAWAPDSQRIALGWAYENDVVLVIDDLSQGGRLVDARTMTTAGDWDERLLAWDASTGDLILRRLCCYPEFVRGDVVSAEPGSGRDQPVAWLHSDAMTLDFDVTGRHALSIRQSGESPPTLYVYERDEPGARRAEEFLDASW